MYPDIFFTPEYQELFKDTAFGGEPCHFIYAGIDYRFYKRPIPNTPYFDIVSPYGYSGPVALQDDFFDSNRIAERCFESQFHTFCLDNKIIAEFDRLHPLEELLYYNPFQRHYEHDILYIDLTKSEDEIWHDFDKGCKSAIKKAERNGLNVFLDSVLPEFPLLYAGAMQKLQAKEGYFFPREFWDKLYKLGQFASVWDKDKNLLSAACILKYGDYAHYFLSASVGDNSGATNLLIWEAIKWAKTYGCKIFNLGGGLKAGDSLESFKRSFTKLSKPFYTYRKIHNEQVYDELCRAKNIDANTVQFFPAYRAERERETQ